MRRLRRIAVGLFGGLGLLVALGPVSAEAAGCFPVADRGAPPREAGPLRAAVAASLPEARLWPAAADASEPLPEGATVRLTFLGHASFLIETRGGITAVTDYNDYVGAPLVPSIITMNNAHSTHYSLNPPGGVAHVLRGWNDSADFATHDVTVGDLRVRNIPTAVHGRSGSRALGNSMFVFEAEDLCIAHLGHLHHRLTEEQVAELGQIDIALVPIDGAYTMSQEEMIEVIEQIRPELVVPMHYFGSSVLARFASLIGDRWPVKTSATPSVALSRSTLPSRQVLVLPGT